MTMDANGMSHTPAGMPGAGRFDGKAGTADAGDVPAPAGPTPAMTGGLAARLIRGHDDDPTVRRAMEDMYERNGIWPIRDLDEWAARPDGEDSRLFYDDDWNVVRADAIPTGTMDEYGYDEEHDEWRTMTRDTWKPALHPADDTMLRLTGRETAMLHADTPGWAS